MVCDLGVDVDPLLKFDAHINRIIGKAYCRIGVLFKGFTSRNSTMLKLAYITYVRPILEYASNVWSPHLIKHINALERVQKYFTKRIPALSNLSYPERLAAMDLESLELRRLKCDLVMYFKCLNNIVALPSQDFFIQSVTNTQTRAGGNRLYVPIISNNHFANDFFNRCIVCYNSLPVEVVSVHSVTIFKNLINNIDFSRFLHCSYFS